MTTTTKTTPARREMFSAIPVDLTHTDGNAFALMGAVAGAMRFAGGTDAEINEFYAEAKSGDYDYLQFICHMWIDAR